MAFNYSQLALGQDMAYDVQAQAALDDPQWGSMLAEMVNDLVHQRNAHMRHDEKLRDAGKDPGRNKESEILYRERGAMTQILLKVVYHWMLNSDGVYTVNPKLYQVSRILRAMEELVSK